MPRCHRIARAMLLAGLAIAAACSSFGGAVPRAWDYRPRWLDALHERTSPVPPLAAPGDAPLATPTQWPVQQVPLGRGVPRDHTQPIAWSFEARVSLEQLGYGLRQLGVAPELLGRELSRLGVTPEDSGVTPAQLVAVLEALGVASPSFDAQLRALVATPQKVATVLGQLGVPPELMDLVFERLGTSAGAMARALGDVGRMPRPRSPADARGPQGGDAAPRSPSPQDAGAAPASAPLPNTPVMLGVAATPSAGAPRLDAGALGLLHDLALPAPLTETAPPPSSGLAATQAPGAAGAEVGAPSHAHGTARSVLERMYAGGPAPAGTPEPGLEQFGYAYFDAPVRVDDDGPVPPDYVVMGGDELTLTFTGSIVAKHRVTVQRSGEVILPEIGVVDVAGQAFGELARHVTDFVTRVGNRRNFQVAVTMGRLRHFRVHAVGEVERPGFVEVPGRASLLTALAAAGGPRATGSLRRVVLRRAGRAIAEVDLYRFLLTGDDTDVPALQAGDVIFVPAIGATIGVAGHVQRPGIYELLGDATVAAALELAGGLTPFAYRAHAQIESGDGGRGRRPRDIALDERGLAEPMRDGELLRVAAVETRRQPVVELVGEVSRPGGFEFRDGMRVHDLLELGDGLTVDAYLPQAILSRVVGEPEAVATAPGRDGLGVTRRVLIVDLSRALQRDPAHDLLLAPLDRLEVRALAAATVLPTVTVTGAVRHPGTYALTAGLRVSALLAIAGNLLPDANHDDAELVRRRHDGDRGEIAVDRHRFDLGAALRGTDDPALANGDEVFVRTLRTARVEVHVAGEVRFPGAYVFPHGARISDLIAAAGGATPRAEIRGAVFTRQSVRELQQRRFAHLRDRTRATYEQALEGMVQNGSSQEGLAARVALSQTAELLDRMQGAQSDGRVVVPFLRDDFPGSAADLALEDGDRLEIPMRQATVTVVGHVFNAGSFVAEPGQNVGDLIARSGGIADDGDRERVYVIEADGTVRSLDQGENRLRYATPVLPGDVVLVPRRPLSRTLGSQLADLFQVARSFGEAALLIDAIGNGGGIDFTSVHQARQSGLSVGDKTFLDR